VKNPGNTPRAGAVRKGRKGPQVGSGGQGRQALEGRKPTPKAEDRPYHPAGKRKAAAERYEAAGGTRRSGGKPSGAPQQPSNRGGQSRVAKSADESEMVTGRNSVLEALRAKIPAHTLYMAARIEFDDRDHLVRITLHQIKVAHLADRQAVILHRTRLRESPHGSVEDGLVIRVLFGELSSACPMH